MLHAASQTPLPLFTIMSAGKPTMVGASLSVTVMVKLPSVVSPAASVAVYVIVVAPTGNVAPLANPAVCAIVDPVQLSAEVGSTHVTSAPQTPASVFTVCLQVNYIVGASLSVTVTVKLAEKVLELASVAV